MTKKLTPLKLPSSGETIQTFPISLMAIIDALKREEEWKEPEPPLLEVEIAGHKTWERNYADPDFPLGYKIWEGRIEQEAIHRLLRRIALKQHLTDEVIVEVREYREALDEPGMHSNDKVLWLYEFAIGDDSDIRKILEFVTAMKDPQDSNVKKK